MKSCPVCHARCFDDMETCFGCLHDFCADDHSALEVNLLATGFLEEPKMPASQDGGDPSHGGRDALPVPEAPKRPFALQFGMNSHEGSDASAGCVADDCGNADGTGASDGPDGPDGPDGTDGAGGTDGTDGADSADGRDAGREEGEVAVLLAVDIGNTHTVLGVFEGDALRKTWRVSTMKDRTADEVVAQLHALLHAAGYGRDDVSGTVFASVVPRLTDEWRRALATFADAEPVMCIAQNAGGLFEADYPNPDEIGQDRIADAIALKVLYGAPAVVVDFGTATNIEIIDERGRFCGGIIAPGVETSMAALFGNASRLAMVDLEAPGSVVGKNTAQAIQSGIVYGEAARVDGLLRRIYEALGCHPVVVATGGLATLVAAHSSEIQKVDGDLTLQGLRLLYGHCRGSAPSPSAAFSEGNAD